MLELTSLLKRSIFLIIFLFIATVNADDDNDVANQLTVSGEGKVSIIAKTAHVRLSVEVFEKNASLVQKSLSRNSAKVLSFLKRNGAKKIETESMHIYPEYSRDKLRNILRYKGSLGIKFEAHHDKAGTLIDNSIQAGANRVDNIMLKPTDEQIQEAKLKALALASTNALEKSEAVLSALKFKMTGITKIQISDHRYIPYYAQATPMLKSMDAARAPSTKILDKTQDISANVTLTLSYQ